MTDSIQPFYRVSPARGRRGRWVVRLARAHFALVGVVLFGAALALLAYLFTLELKRVQLSWPLRIERAGDIYQASVQWKMAATVGLALGSVLYFRAASALERRDRQAVRWTRLAATLLLISLPAGLVLWWRADQAGNLGATAQLLQDVQTVARATALLLMAQGILALSYWVLSTRSLAEDADADRQRAHARGWARLTRAIGVAWLIVLLALGIVLGVLTDWLYELPVARPEPGELLYATTFDDFNDEWDVYAGRDAVQVQAVPDEGGQPNPALIVEYGSGAPDEVVWSVLDRKFSDFDLRVTARLLEGPVDQNQFGVVFRYRDESNFYIFRISADGYYSLGRVRNGVQEKISDWGVSELIRQGNALNEIRVIGYGDEFRFFINGQPAPLCLKGENETSMWANWEGPGICYTSEPAAVFRDEAFAQGRIGLAAGTIDGSDVAVAFDDVIVTGPDPAIWGEE